MRKPFALPARVCYHNNHFDTCPIGPVPTVRTIRTIQTMKRILPLLLACAALSARAELLFYDGFATTTDSQNRTPYQSSAATHALKDANAKSTAWTTGYVENSTWATGTGTIFTFKDLGLSLPTAFAEGTGDPFSARGGSAGYLQTSGGLGSIYRNVNRSVSSMPTSGTLFFRCLMSIEAVTLNALKTTTHYLGAGLSTRTYQSSYEIGSALANAGFRIYFVGTAADAVQLKVRFGTDQYGLLVGNVTAGTTYLCIVGIDYDTGKASAYAAPVADYDPSFEWTIEDLDASAVTGSPMKVVYIDGVYQTAKGHVLFDEFAAGTELEDVAFAVLTRPKLKDGSLAFANGIYSVSASLTNSAATVSYVLFDGTTATTNAIAAFDNGDTVAGTFAAPTDDTTYEVLLVAENAGGETDELSLGTIYGGTLSLAKVSDADERGLVPATLTVSRSDSAPLPLVVNYSFADGTAVAGQNYVDDAGSVTIPAGQASATITVHPLVDGVTESDTTMTVSLAAGHYTAPAAVAVTIANFTTPAGYNYWMGGTATDGKFLASTAANWSAGHVPTAAENVYFDGYYSSANCTWDADATATVASWTQTNGYAGVITLNTVYPGKGDFQCLTVTGPMAVMSGTITHPQSRTQSQNAADYLQDLLDNETYRVRIDAGSLVVGTDGRIDARNKGYYHSNTGNHTSPLPSHGGWFGASGQAPYDDVKEPIHIGMPYKRASGTYYIGIGGGAVYLTSAGTIVVDGYIGADTGSDTWNRGYTLRCGGAGGSVYVRGSSVTGTGTISASAVATSEQNYRGVGGRVAVISTSSTPVDYTTLSLKATVHPFNNNNGQSSTYGSCGTVFVKDATQNYGTLLLQNVAGIFAPTIDRCTPATAEGDWTFDAIGLGNRAVLAIPVGTALHLPGGLDSVFSLNASGSTAYGSIRYEGGTLDLGSATDQTVNGNWMLTPWTNLTVNADITVKGGGAIGIPAMADVLDNDAAGETAKLPSFVSCNLTVNGDLTVESGGFLLAKQCGLKKYANSINSGFRGVLPGHTHGGRCLFFKDLEAQGRYYVAYDSIFAPFLPGNSVPYPNGQSAESSGGVITLVVTGALTLDGEANANGMLETYAQGGNCSGGTGGAIDITAGTLSGSGRIFAEGGAKQAQRGSGGRIAVKLTSPSADFSDFSGAISASGRALGSGGTADSSAGTVYLQTAADGDKGGTIRIAMSAGNQAAGNTNTTEMVSLGYGGDAVADYKRVSYVVSDYGHAAVNTDFQTQTVTIADATSSIDLEGHELTVRDFIYAETDGETVRIRHLTPGIYGWSALEGYAWAFDTSAEKSGTLRVLGAGTVIIVK